MARAAVGFPAPDGEGAIVLSFPPFRLDLDDERLWKNGQEMHLRRKPFAILRHLVQHPQRLVSQHEEGTPQGGPLSPLLANVLLDEVDKELEALAHSFATITSGLPSPFTSAVAIPYAEEPADE